MFVNRAGSLVVPFLALYLSKALGFEPTFATIAIGAFGAGSMAASLLGGYLADRVGRKPVMLLALVGGAATLIVFPSFQTQWAVVSGIAVFALLSDMYRPAASALISDLVDPELRPRAFSLMYVAVNLGFTVGAVAGGWFAERSFDLLFTIDAATSLAYAVLIAVGIRDTLDASRRETSSGGERRFDAVIHMMRNRAFVRFCASNFIVALVFHQGMSTLPLHLAEEGIGPKDYGRIVAVNGVLIVLFQLPLTSFLMRFHRGIVMAGGALFVAIGFGVTGLVSGALLYAATVVLWTVGEMMMAAFMSPIVTDLAPAELRARYFGAFTLSFAAAMCVGPPIGGLVLESLGSRWLWAACFGLGSLAAIGMLSVRDALAAPPLPNRGP